MGFINSASTVTVQAFLTAAGRKKLFDSLETVNEPFITKFALGDSDANYGSIEAGFGTLNAGAVPEAGEWKPRIRSFVLAQDRYKPSVAHILVNGRYGGSEGHYSTFPIGNNNATQQTYKIETEWPKGTRYEESYDIDLTMAGANGLSDVGLFVDLFDWSFEGGVITLSFRGDADQSVLDNIIGANEETNNGWTLQFRIEADESAVTTVLNVDFVK